jgi:N-acetylglucosamine-6-phosphate deacetylase
MIDRTYAADYGLGVDIATQCPRNQLTSSLGRLGDRSPDPVFCDIQHYRDEGYQAIGHVQKNSWKRAGVASAVIDGALVPGDMALDGDEIAAVGLSGNGSGMAVPGFVDLQVNGYAGIDVLSAGADELLSMGEALLRDGVFAYQPTIITAALDAVRQALGEIHETTCRTTNGATIIGAHLEGPFLSPARPGTHSVAHLRTPDLKLLDELLASGTVSMVTLAPELIGAVDLIEACHHRDVVVSLGHSAASAKDAKRGFEAGATAVTHLFNAMEPFSGRNPGLAGTALVTPGITLQLIADKVHLSDEALLLATTAGPERWTVVSDTIAAAGVGDGVVRLGEITVFVEGGVARREDGTIAGSVAKLHEGLSRMIRLGLPVPSVIDAVTSRPARLVGSSQHGVLRIGGPANFVILDDHYGISRVVVAGQEIDRA